MKRTNELQALLESLTALYNDGESVSVRFDSASYADIDGNYVAVAPNVRDAYGRDVSRVNELRIVVDTLSHEVEHIRETDLTVKRDFARMYPKNPKAAGAVVNILEDIYIDGTRTGRFPGLRKSLAFKIDTIMSNHHRRPRIDKMEAGEAHIEGLTQLAFAGYVKGVTDAPDDVREFLATVKPLVDDVRHEHDREAREEIFRRVADELVSRIPDGSAEEYVENEIEMVDVGDVPDAGDLEDEEKQEEGTNPGAGKDENGAQEDENGAQEDDDGQPAGGDGDVGTPDGDAGNDRGSARQQMSPAEMEKAMEELDEGDENRTSGDWWDAGDEEDYTEADDSDLARLSQLDDKLDQKQTDVGRRIHDRDRSLGGVGDHDYKTTADHIRGKMEARGLADEIREAFHELKTREKDRPARRGQRVNMRGVVRRVSGDGNERNLYLNRQQVETGDRAVGVAIDLSGSMNLNDSMTAMAALGLATEEIGDDLVASGFKTNQAGTTTPLITGPGEAWKWEHLNAATTGGFTPTAAGVSDVETLLSYSNRRQKIMVVVTDGEPNVCLDEGTSDMHAESELKRLVAQVRQNNIPVIGLAVGTGINRSTMQYVFGREGEGYATTDMANLADTLVQIYRSQLRTT